MRQIAPAPRMLEMAARFRYSTVVIRIAWVFLFPMLIIVVLGIVMLFIWLFHQAYLPTTVFYESIRTISVSGVGMILAIAALYICEELRSYREEIEDGEHRQYFVTSNHYSFQAISRVMQSKMWTSKVDELLADWQVIKADEQIASTNTYLESKLSAIESTFVILGRIQMFYKESNEGGEVGLNLLREEADTELHQLTESLDSLVARADWLLTKHG